MSAVVDRDSRERAARDEEARAGAPAELRCPSCGAPAEPGQLMCLECGSRLALGYQRPPSWRLPAAIVALVVLLAGAAVAFALANVSDDATRTAAQAPAPAGQTGPQGAQGAPGDTQPPTGSQTAPAESEAAPTPTEPTPVTGGATAPAPAETTTSASPAAATATGWPPGKEAFTVILASMPTKAAAEDKLQAAKDAGIAGAAILHSDDFPTLRPGYWVVFDGQYDAIDQATSQVEQDRGKGFGDAYPRFVSKNEDAKP
jgi:hypothetical protein